MRAKLFDAFLAGLVIVIAVFVVVWSYNIASWLFGI